MLAFRKEQKHLCFLWSCFKANFQIRKEERVEIKYATGINIPIEAVIFQFDVKCTVDRFRWQIHSQLCTLKMIHVHSHSVSVLRWGHTNNIDWNSSNVVTMIHQPIHCLSFQIRSISVCKMCTFNFFIFFRCLCLFSSLFSFVIVYVHCVHFSFDYVPWCVEIETLMCWIFIFILFFLYIIAISKKLTWHAWQTNRCENIIFHLSTKRRFFPSLEE